MIIETKNGIYKITLKLFYGIGFGFFKQTLRNQRVNSFVLFFIKISYKKEF